MIFKQLYEQDSSTYTYLIACEETGQSVLIDPVIDTVERDMLTLKELGLGLTYTLETHMHADHLTGAKKLKQFAGSKIVVPAMEQLACADLGVSEGTPFMVGNIKLEPLFTPGHTGKHHAYLLDNGMQKILFTGDALLIEACGRTDFQSGDPVKLYESITQKFFTLPDETIVYPAHDYEGRQITTIGQEKNRNPRLGNNKSQDEFVDIMNGLDLPYPRKIDFAVPGNEACGECPGDIPEEYRGPCDIVDLPQDLIRAVRAGDQG
ncbi:MBL fold metallo-hydrolase [uncultured Cocleimonas sp.]|uniref:MBL fold metallo-hydrolase n=1 Tax=uncultured Cocleimonas sp. TaxID=1051587 RepID=UPI0026351B4C|nr:MBL fold metallo-hydrolase [uncultured Cocleimonas sp.]